MHALPPRPASDSAAGKLGSVRPVRAYEAWEGNNKFLFQGRLILGPDWRSLPLTIFLIVAPVVVFCVFVARKLMDDFPHHLGILIMVFAVVFTLYDLLLLLLISGRDPGIIPRSAHPPEPEYYVDAETGVRRAVRFPRVKEAVVNGTAVKTKYCDTCLHYRPPRCSHCSICDNCMERFDHHCPWVGQCIGKRNYRFFFMFVSSSTLLCVYVFSFCWVYIIRIMHSERTSVWKAMVRTPASMALVIYTFLAIWFVGGLTVFHLYLICTNQTTYESYRNRRAQGNFQRPHPYNRGIIRNFKEVFCSRIPPSNNNFRAIVAKEIEIPHQVAGGCFSSTDSGKTMSDLENGRKLFLEDLAVINGDELDNKVSRDGSLDKDIEPAAVSPTPDPSQDGAEPVQETQDHRKSSLSKRIENQDIPSDASLGPDLVRDSAQHRHSSSRSVNQDIPSDESPPDLHADLQTEEGVELVGDSTHSRQSSWRRSVGDKDVTSDSSPGPDLSGSLHTEEGAEVVCDSSDPRQRRAKLDM